MTDIASVSKSDLTTRRRQLRRQRRWRVLHSIWRMLAVSGIAGGLIWTTTLPVWMIQRPSQIEIDGNEVLSDSTVQTLVPFDYPQPLLQVQPEAIATHLEAQAPIADATVIRHLFPPGLTITIQERHPVALLIQGNDSAASATPYPTPSPSIPPANHSNTSLLQVGLIDEKGFWMPLDDYLALNQTLELPTLKVIGMRSQDRTQWTQLYQDLLRSPVQIYEVDWREPANLILKTELGLVHMGPYGTDLPQKLHVLDQLRTLPNAVPPERIEYIDLISPDVPMVYTNEPINTPTQTPDETQ